MEDLDSTFSLPSLLCEEDESCLNELEGTRLNSNFLSISKSEDEYIQLLIEKEAAISESNGCIDVFAIDCSEKSKNRFKCARLEAMNWILNTREMLGFHFRTAYLSMAYFDRFTSRRFIDNGKVWAIRLLSIACLSLAAKMEEQKVPALSQYQVDDYNFESSVIHRMELLVLNTLEWRMCSITPFAFLHHFISKFSGHSKPKDLALRAIELILALTKEINLMDHRPSVIAAAAVLAVFDHQLTRKALECKLSVMPSWGSIEKECIFSCYNLLQEMETKNNSTPDSLISPSVLTNVSSSSDVLEKSTTICAVGTKRKLTYNDFEQHCPLQKFSRI